MDDAELVLPSAGPDPIPFDTALAAVLGYARGRRPLHFRAPNSRTGRWVRDPGLRLRAVRPPRRGSDLPARRARHPHRRGPARPARPGRLGGDEERSGRRPPARRRRHRPRRRPRRSSELPDDEFSVLAEPGTVGALLRTIWQRARRPPASRRSTSPRRCTTAVPTSSRCSSAPPAGSCSPTCARATAASRRSSTASSARTPTAFAALQPRTRRPAASRSPSSGCTTSCCGSAAASG